MRSNEQNQVQRRGMLQNMCYSTVKSFFDSAGVEINGDGKGEPIGLIALVKDRKF